MTRKKAEKKAEKIAKGITDKIECNTVDIDEWAEFWGFTREEYEEFLDTAIKALEQKPKKGNWIRVDDTKMRCSNCDIIHLIAQYPIGAINYCPNCGCHMVEPQESEVNNEYRN